MIAAQHVCYQKNSVEKAIKTKSEIFELTKVMLRIFNSIFVMKEKNGH